MDRPITLILAATTPALGIGKNGALPWRLKREMKYFRQSTEGGIVVMGRKTWESIPSKFRPLKNRTNVVVSSNQQLQVDEGVIAALSLQDALDKVSSIDGKLFIIGGAQLYGSALSHPATKHILLTEIEDPDSKFECDRFFEFDQSNWKKQPEQVLRSFVGPNVELDSPKVTEDDTEYTFTLYSRD